MTAIIKPDTAQMIPKYCNAHGSMGLVVMIIGLLQPINAYFRPHKDKNHPITKNRQLWQ